MYMLFCASAHLAQFCSIAGVNIYVCIIDVLFVLPKTAIICISFPPAPFVLRTDIILFRLSTERAKIHRLAHWQHTYPFPILADISLPSKLNASPFRTDEFRSGGRGFFFFNILLLLFSTAK